MLSGCRGVYNQGGQLDAAVVWQGAKFEAIQGDALLIGVDDYWAFVSMEVDGAWNQHGCDLPSLPPRTILGGCNASVAANGSLPEGVRCQLGCETRRFGHSDTDRWSTSRPGTCYEGVFVWSGACAESRCDAAANPCEHNGSCWVFPPPLSDWGVTPLSAPVAKECVCPSGWWGERCEILDLCVMDRDGRRRDSSREPPPCLHGGACLRTADGAARPSVECDCAPGYDGARCEIAPWEVGGAVALAAFVCLCLPLAVAVWRHRKRKRSLRDGQPGQGAPGARGTELLDPAGRLPNGRAGPPH